MNFATGSPPGGKAHPVIVVPAVTLIVLVMSSCTAETDNSSSAIVDSAGVRIVNNVGTDHELTWDLEQVIRIGGQDQGPHALVRVNPQGVATDSQGRLYVLDVGDPAVHVFDTAGEHVRSIGRRGGGPGEFMRPAALYVTGAGDVRVLDTQKRSFVRFGADGSVEAELRLPDPRLATEPKTVLLSSGELVTAVGSGSTCAGCPLQTTVLLFPEASHDTSWAEPAALAVIDWFQPTSFNPVGVEGCFRIATPPVFWRYPVWRYSHGALLYNAVDEYVIDKLPDVLTLTDARQSIRRDMPVVAARREHAAAEIGAMTGEFEGPQCSASGEERADQATWAERIPWILDALYSPNGKHYVLRRAPGQHPASRIDVFDSEGTYIGTLPPAFPFPVTFRRDDEIVVLEYDQLGQVLVVVYRLRT